MDDAIFTLVPGCTDRITGCNRTGAAIPAHTPVEILSAARPRRNSEVPRRVPFLLRRISRDTAILGVTLTAIPNNDCGEVQISGLARCNIADTTLTPSFVIAGDGELVPASSGWPTFIISSPQRIVFILLGGGFTNYIGTFAVIPRDGGYYCYDSSHPDSAVAGTTDIGDVPAGTIPCVDGRFSLYLWHDGETYQQSFSCPSATHYGTVTLAELACGAPRQCWTQGIIHWSQWYLL